jgi:hypothetical protein
MPDGFPRVGTKAKWHAEPQASSLADLDSCRARVARAKDKLNALNARIDQFLAEDHYAIVVERDDDGRDVAVFRTNREVPVDWGDDAGEIVDALRSALDHLVYQLAIDSQIIEVTESTRTQFPIFVDHGDYTRGGRRSWREQMLVGVASKHRHIIDNLQPYQRRNRSGHDPLELLRGLSDPNKHRTRIVPLAYMAYGEFRYDQPDNLFGLDMQEVPNDERQDGDIVMTAPIMSIPGADIQMKLQIGETRFDVGFRGDIAVSRDDLDRIVLHVSGIIGRFATRIRR